MTDDVSPLGIMRLPPKKQPVPSYSLPGGRGPLERPSPAGRPRRPNRLMGNGKRVALLFLGGTCGLLFDSCGRPELPRGDPDEALEVLRELALVREAGAGGDLRQGQ